ncbi:MAG: DUF6174 domain-containing protein [Tepidisphaeraceae bacterium]
MRRRFSRMIVVALFGSVLFAVPALALAVTPVGPGEQPDPQIRDGSAQRELDAARERWREYAAASYRMRVRVQCFCPQEITRPRMLIVRSGHPVGPIPAHLRPYATVPRLFARIQDAIDGSVAQLTTEYGRHGLPRTIYVDRSFAIADEERAVGVDRFRRR